jgi:hypothetical protein
MPSPATWAGGNFRKSAADCASGSTTCRQILVERLASAVLALSGRCAPRHLSIFEPFGSSLYAIFMAVAGFRHAV